MRSKHFLAFALVGVGLGMASLAGTGCGGGNGETGGTGGAGTGGQTSSSSSTSTSSSTSSSGTGGTATGNHDFDSAIDIGGATMTTPGTLVDAATPDFYKFSGNKGDHVVAFTSAQSLTGSTDLQDPAVIDTVLTIYDAGKNPIAIDDDAHPRNNDTDSVLFTQLPATGDYYLKIEDCNSYAASNPSSGINCAPPDGIMTFDYEVFVGAVLETVGKAGSTVNVAYTDISGNPGIKQGQVLAGSFAAMGEKQSFQFAAPADLKTDPAAAPAAYFYVQPSGVMDGDGSTTDVKIYVTDDMAGTNIIGWADQTNFTNGDDPVNGPLQFTFPLDTTNLTKPYYAWVQQGGAASKPDSDFYFIWHEIGSIYYGETESATAHGDMATAQALSVPGTNEGTYFVFGNLTTPAEQDWYKVDVPAMVTTSSGMGPPDHAQVGCDVERWGSGLKGFNITLLADDGTTQITKLTETNPAKQDLITGNLQANLLAIPGTLPGKTGFFKVSAASQDATNMGAYYHCAVYFFSTM